MRPALHLALLVSATLALSACATAAAATPASRLEPTPAPSEPAAAECPVTPGIVRTPPDDPNADPFGNGPWVISADDAIWTRTIDWAVGENKTVWIRPANATLELSGRRLNGDSPSLEAHIPYGYHTGFQIAGLTFPAVGCWQVTAVAGESRLDLVVDIR